VQGSCNFTSARTTLLSAATAYNGDQTQRSFASRGHLGYVGFESNGNTGRILTALPRCYHLASAVVFTSARFSSSRAVTLQQFLGAQTAGIAYRQQRCQRSYKKKRNEKNLRNGPLLELQVVPVAGLLLLQHAAAGARPVGF
jgi:hypothetical protein